MLEASLILCAWGLIVRVIACVNFWVCACTHRVDDRVQRDNKPELLPHNRLDLGALGEQLKGLRARARAYAPVAQRGG